ncbi:hypothetical protein TNIN_297321 [Trichonephila inaurata madagascariensis]|uniref:Uncharacterized protein n=1 Tax=Trichonephila inaurata madagascariensis TaxID=2747483 RepID=A0A8X7BRL3_9ARAC|nr:hypothetical protein TNIN_297321 [Trichonephila inaurata madagascariensis]
MSFRSRMLCNKIIRLQGSKNSPRVSIHNLLRECEKNRRILELKTRLIKDLTGVEENSRSPDPTGLQGNHAKMQKFEENRKYLIGELTGLTPCPVQDCLHNTTVKTLRKRLAAGSARGDLGQVTPPPIATANTFSTLAIQKDPSDQPSAETPKPKIDTIVLRFTANSII